MAQSFIHAKLKHRYAYPESDADTPEAPELPSAVTKLLTVQWKVLNCRPVGVLLQL